MGLESRAALETHLEPLQGDRQAYLRPLLIQLSFALAVVVTGCGNSIVKQIATKPLTHYTYILSLADSVAYLPVYGAILCCLVLSKQVPRRQVAFMWRRVGAQRWPYMLLMVASGFASAGADVVGMICTPYVTGPLHSLLSNCSSEACARVGPGLENQGFGVEKPWGSMVFPWIYVMKWAKSFRIQLLRYFSG